MLDNLRDTHFLKLSKLIEQKTGILLPPSKRTMIEGRLRKRVRILGLQSLEDYGVLLFEQDGLVDEMDVLVDSMTTNKTDFFREPDHFDFLRDQAVPALLKSGEHRSAPLKIWSAASSNGSELYTVAMVLASMQGTTPFRFALLGTDICLEMIAQARRAVYPAAHLEPVPDEMKRRFLMTSANPKRTDVRIVPELRRVATFAHLNLMDETYEIDRNVDVIFCRNILIYFSKPNQQAVLKRLASHLRPGGYLILGHSESFALDDKVSMLQVSPTVFQRPTSASLRKVA